MSRRRLGFVLLVGLAATASTGAGAPAGVVFGLNGGASLAGGFRWNADRTVFDTSAGTLERSLEGGLRYSVAGGSYEAYRDAFTWTDLPTVAEFSTAVGRAFGRWTAVDPVTRLGTALRFTEDFGTAVSTTIENFVRLGSEIDLFAANIGFGNRGDAFFNARGVAGGVTLTSGTTGYGGFAISGTDIRMNSNTVWSLNNFETILTHEIGHSVGLGDVEDFGNNGFIDDDYDPADPLGTLTNSWAGLVNPFDPSASAGLRIYDVPNDADGLDADGVDILMESNIPLTFFQNGAELRNDDFGTRQFLYPSVAPVPEPAAGLLVAAAAGLALLRRRRAA